MGCVVDFAVAWSVGSDLNKEQNYKTGTRTNHNIRSGENETVRLTDAMWNILLKKQSTGAVV